MMAYTDRVYEFDANLTQSRFRDLVYCISLGTQQCNTHIAGNQTGRVNSATHYFTKLKSAISQMSEQKSIRYGCCWSVHKIAKGDY